MTSRRNQRSRLRPRQKKTEADCRREGITFPQSTRDPAEGERAAIDEALEHQEQEDIKKPVAA